VALYQGEPVVHNLGALLCADALVAALGRKRFSANSLDQFPRQLACHWMYGSGFFVPVPDVDRTEHMLIIGANPVVSNGGLMTAPGIRRRLQRIRERGGRVVVVDPRRTETAKIADAHHFIRPGTDALFVAALLHTLFAERRLSLDRLAPFVHGVPSVDAAVGEFTPEAVSTRVGIEASTIRAVAREFAEAPRAVCYCRMGTSTVPFGTTTSWLIDVLNVVTGNLDREGGVMFPEPAVDVTSLQPKTERGRWQSRTRGTPEFIGELPTATLAEEIQTPGRAQVHALVTLAGNPVLSSPAGHRLRDALRSLEFMVSIDLYRNETTSNAHVILPPVGPLERDHFDLAFDLFAVRNTARWSPAVFEPPVGGKTDADVLLSLSARLLRRQGGTKRLQGHGLQLLSACGGTRLTRLALDLALRVGPYGSGARFWKDGLRLRSVRDSVHGIDLGPLRPCLPERLPSRADGTERRVDLAAPELIADLNRLRASVEEKLPAMSMIGRRETRTVNSWSHNLPSLVRGRPRCVLYLHPEDAAARRIQNGDTVRVTSRVGTVELPVEVTEDVMPGVVCMPHGYGHHGDDLALNVASEHAGVSMNDLSDPAEIDPLSGNAVFNAFPVTVEASTVSAGLTGRTCMHDDRP
jgi:anaerobic selenocysteine-containing dehydrogenase